MEFFFFVFQWTNNAHGTLPDTDTRPVLYAITKCMCFAFTGLFTSVSKNTFLPYLRHSDYLHVGLKRYDDEG
jgi:hypothetical protein